jgi:hypothetical protein
MLLPFLGGCTHSTCPSGSSAYQARKLRVLNSWRDSLERQLAALNATISTLEQQMARDASQKSQS